MLPIVLHHGIFGYDRMRIGPLGWSYFGGGIHEVFTGRGHPLIVSRVAKTAPIAVRARQLKEAVLDQLRSCSRPNDRVVIFAHSMGGVDARYMISKLGMAHRVAALVTLSTPHRGSSYADWAVRNVNRNIAAQRLLRFLSIDVDAGRDLMLDAMKRFNDEVLDHPDVKYYSVSAARPWHRVPAFLLHSHRIVSQHEGENDGIVSVRSARWGTHLGTWPADHLHVVNRRLVLELRNPTGCVLPRYIEILDTLVRDGVLPDVPAEFQQLPLDQPAPTVKKPRVGRFLRR